MGIITRMRKQTAVYWPPASVNASGRTVYGTAVEIDCRWEDGIVKFIDNLGNEVLGKSTVYVDRDVELGGYLWLGLLAGAPANPTTDAAASEIRSFSKLPKLSGTEILRTVIL